MTWEFKKKGDRLDDKKKGDRLADVRRNAEMEMGEGGNPFGVTGL